MNRKSITQEYFTLAVDENGNMPPMRRDEVIGFIKSAVTEDDEITPHDRYHGGGCLDKHFVLN